MNAALVIDAIVRQTTVLIAALATSAGQRAPLSHVADQVFADLVRELKEQGVGQKVIADMFGMALRTYQARVSRLSESATERGRSLWEAVLAHVQERGTAARVDVLRRFGDDDEGVVRGVLRDLVESGLVYQTGRGEGIAYRAAPGDEPLARQHESRSLDNLVLIAVHRRGPLNRAALREIVPVDDDLALEESLARLVQEGSVRRASREDEAEYDCDQCVPGRPLGCLVQAPDSLSRHRPRQPRVPMRARDRRRVQHGSREAPSVPLSPRWPAMHDERRPHRTVPVRRFSRRPTIRLNLPD